jgi:hypothetical protein
MGWEARRGRGRYYTRTRKVAGRCVREYVGTGPAAEAAAAADVARRQAAAARRAAEAAARRRWAGPAAARAFTRAVAHLVRGALAAHGFFQHAQGAWRRRQWPRQPQQPTQT